MHHLDYLGSIERDAQALADTAEGNLQAKVSGCPGWNVADLVWHITGVHHFWGTIVHGLLQDPEQVEELERPGVDAELIRLCRDRASFLVQSLRSADQAAPVWTWATQKDVAFVIRHQAQEAAVHRWDAEDAAGRDFSIDPQVAADAIDEYFEFSTKWRREDAEPVSGTVQLHATDAAGDWVVSEDGEGRLRVESGPGEADASVAASASDLLLMLYRRVGTERGDVSGNAPVIDRFFARTDND